MNKNKETFSDLIVFLNQILKIPIHISTEYARKYDINNDDSAVVCMHHIIAGERENIENRGHCARIEQFLNRYCFEKEFL